jgi:hypothetical protein
MCIGQDRIDRRSDEMAIKADYSFKCRAEMQTARRQRDHIRLIYFFISMGFLFSYISVDVVGKALFGKAPMTWLLNSSYRWPFLLLVGLLATGFFFYFDQSKLQARNKRVYRACAIASTFEKAESALITSMNGKAIEPVQRALEKLEALNVFFSEMPEYNELLAKGRSWLSEHQEK